MTPVTTTLMRQELREAAIVSAWIVPAAFVANLVGFLFLLALEGRRSTQVGYIGYLAIPMAIGLVTFRFGLRERPRAERMRDALAVRPIALYLFIATIGLLLWWGYQHPGFEMIGPIGIAPIAASVAGIFSVVWNARPLRAR